MTNLSKTDKIYLSVFLLLLFMQGVFFIDGGWKASVNVFPVPIDDAYIHAQYAKNFARGLIFTWSEGDGYSKGSSSPLYVLILAFGYLVGFHGQWIMLFASMINFISVYISLCLLYFLLSKSVSKVLAFFSVCLWISSGAMMWGLFSGMEIGISSLSIVLFIWFYYKELFVNRNNLSKLFYLTASALPLLRPESIITVFILSIFLFFIRIKKDGLYGLKIIVIPLLPFFLLLTLNWVITGSPLMNSMNLKSIWADPNFLFGQKFSKWISNVINIPQSLNEAFFGYYRDTGLFLVIFGLLCSLIYIYFTKEKYFILSLGLSFIAETLFLCGQKDAIGGSSARYFQPYIPILIILLAYGGHCISSLKISIKNTSTGLNILKSKTQFYFSHNKKEYIGIILIAAIIICLLPSIFEKQKDFVRMSKYLSDYHVFLGRNIKEENIKKPGICKRIATFDAGALMYYSDVKGFDLLGLCSEIKGYPLIKASLLGFPMPFEAMEKYFSQAELPDWSFIYIESDEAYQYKDEVIIDPLNYGAIQNAQYMATMKGFRFPKELIRSSEEPPKKYFQDGWTVADKIDIGELNSETYHNFKMELLENSYPEISFIKEQKSKIFIDDYNTTMEDSNKIIGDVGRGVCSKMSFRLKNSMLGKPCKIIANAKIKNQCKIEISVNSMKNIISFDEPADFKFISLMDIDEADDEVYTITLNIIKRPPIVIGHVWLLVKLK